MKENETKTQKKAGSGVAKKIINTIINVMIVIVLIISLLIAVMSLSSKARGISVLFGHTVEIVQTDSMKGGSEEYEGGDFSHGDLIIGKFMDRDMDAVYNEGDIVTYKGDLDGDPETEEYICHRIIEATEYENGRVYRTKGDNNEIADQYEGELSKYITSSDIVSKFYSEDYHGTVIKGAGSVLSFLRTKLGFFICILVPMIIFFLYELIRVIFNFAYYRKAREEEGKEEKQAEIDAAVAEALAEKEASETPMTPEDMTPEQMEQFKAFLAQQKQQEAEQEPEQETENEE